MRRASPADEAEGLRAELREAQARLESIGAESTAAAEEMVRMRGEMAAVRGKAVAAASEAARLREEMCRVKAEAEAAAAAVVAEERAKAEELAREREEVG